MTIKATKNDGSVIELWPHDPLGHPNNPMDDDDVRNKFWQTVEPVYGKDKSQEVLEGWWRIRD